MGVIELIFQTNGKILSSKEIPNRRKIGYAIVPATIEATNKYAIRIIGERKKLRTHRIS